MTSDTPGIVALSGGVGGAKLVLGLRDVLPPDGLTVIANTGDDFDHLGLRICPDIDTLIYTLSGEANPETGWGRRDETWQFMAALERLGGDTWFRLGDRDLATHVFRRDRLNRDDSLSEVTAALARRMGVSTRIMPMAETEVATVIDTADGTLAFQDYFVRRRAEPVATGIRHEGANEARLPTALHAWLRDAACEAVLITPSNPWLSIAPILSVADLRSTLLDGKAPIVAVSPIVGGRALKGPTAKLMRELGFQQSVAGIAAFYGARAEGGLLDGLIIDEQDAEYRRELEATGLTVGITQTIMNDLQDKQALARYALGFATALREQAG